MEGKPGGGVERAPGVRPMKMNGVKRIAAAKANSACSGWAAREMNMNR